MILSEKILTLRKQLGWSQEELAEKLDVSRQSVSKWEVGAAIPDLDKILALSELFGVSTDYLLKDSMEELVYRQDEEKAEGRVVSAEEAHAYMNLCRKLAGRMAGAVSLLILSPVCVIQLEALAEFGKTSMSETTAGAIGGIVLLLMVAVGVAILIYNGMQLSKYEYLEKDIFSLQYGVEGIVEKRKSEFENRFRLCIVTGVVLCITGVLPILIAEGLSPSEMIEAGCTSALFVFVAVGVFCFIWGGTIQGSYNKLLQVDDYTPENKLADKKLSFFPGCYWLIVTAIFLIILFTGGKSAAIVMIWPVAGILFAVVYMLLKAIAKRKNNQ